jgi:hypothetical protein
LSLFIGGNKGDEKKLNYYVIIQPFIYMYV